jgi:hypothetical protein
MDIKKIQQVLDEAKNSELNKKNINLRISALNRAADPVWKENASKKTKELWNDKEYRTKIQSSMKSRSENEVWRENNRRALEKIHKNASKANKKAWKKVDRKQHSINTSIGLRKSIGRKIVTPEGTFDCIAEWKNLKKVKGNFLNKTQQMPHLYYYEDEGPGETTYETVFYSPMLTSRLRTPIFEKALECNYENINEYKPKSRPNWWNKMKKLYPNEFYEKLEPKREWDLEDGE